MGKTIRQILEAQAERDGNNPFVYFRDQVVEYTTLNKNVNKAAHLLRECGLEKGDHVCLFLPNCPEFLYIWFGLAKIGGVMVPLNVNLRGDGLRYIIHHCDARWIVVDERLYDAYAFVEKDLPEIKQKIWKGFNGKTRTLCLLPKLPNPKKRPNCQSITKQGAKNGKSGLSRVGNIGNPLAKSLIKAKFE